MTSSMAGEWSTAATRALISVWGAADVQAQLDGVLRNRSIYQNISRELLELGYDRTWEQCRTKVKNLVKRYRKVSCVLI